MEQSHQHCNVQCSIIDVLLVCQFLIKSALINILGIYIDTSVSVPGEQDDCISPQNSTETLFSLVFGVSDDKYERWLFMFTLSESNLQKTQGLRFHQTIQ